MSGSNSTPDIETIAEAGREFARGNISRSQLEQVESGQASLDEVRSSGGGDSDGGSSQSDAMAVVVSPTPTVGRLMSPTLTPKPTSPTHQTPRHLTVTVVSADNLRHHRYHQAVVVAVTVTHHHHKPQQIQAVPLATTHNKSSPSNNRTASMPRRFQN